MHRPIPVAIDDRERAGPVPDLLAQAGIFESEVRRLAVGDYLVDGRFLFERKTLADLALSIKQGRLFSQALRLAASPLQTGLILEGMAGDLKGSGMHWEAVQGALVTVALFVGLPILRTRTPLETVRTFQFAAVQGRTVADGALPRRGRRPKGKAAVQSYVLQGLPGIGPERAKRLLERFGTVEGVLTASADELESVPGIGERIARLMRWAVEENRGIYEVEVATSPPPSGSHPVAHRWYANLQGGVPLGYAHKHATGAANSLSPKGTTVSPSYKTIPSLNSLSQARASFFSPLKSDAVTVAAALTSMPTTLPSSASTTTSTSSWSLSR